jgi:molybdopterin converting factor small subunit
MGNKINWLSSPLYKMIEEWRDKIYNEQYIHRKLPLQDSMKVELNLFASLARYAPDKIGSHSQRMLDVTEGTTIMGLLNSMELPIDKIRMIFLNGLHATGDEVLKEGDRVGVFPPVAGG